MRHKILLRWTEYERLVIQPDASECVFGHWKYVCVNDDACTKEIKEDISDDLYSRYKPTAIQKFLRVASYLDPHCTSLPFLSDSKKFVVEDLEDHLSVQDINESSNHPEETDKEID